MYVSDVCLCVCMMYNFFVGSIPALFADLVTYLALHIHHAPNGALARRHDLLHDVRVWMLRWIQARDDLVPHSPHTAPPNAATVVELYRLFHIKSQPVS